MAYSPLVPLGASPLVHSGAQPPVLSCGCSRSAPQIIVAEDTEEYMCFSSGLLLIPLYPRVLNPLVPSGAHPLYSGLCAPLCSLVLLFYSRGAPQIIVAEDTEECMRFSDAAEVQAQQREAFPLLVSAPPYPPRLLPSPLSSWSVPLRSPLLPSLLVSSSLSSAPPLQCTMGQRRKAFYCPKTCP